MSDCTSCGGRAELFICPLCINELRKLLTDAAWWIARCDESAVGHVRLGDSGGRRVHRSGLEQYADPKPAVDGRGGTEGQRRLERDMEGKGFAAKLLAQGRVNARASEHVEKMTDDMKTWCRHLSEQRGITWLPLNSVEHWFIGPLEPAQRRLAKEYRATWRDALGWLRANVGAIACDEAAAECLNGIKGHLRAIEGIVNRPVEPRTCGPCPQTLEDGTKCGTELLAPPDEPFVTCPHCKVTQSVDSLIARLMAETSYMLYTIPELCNVVLPKLQIPIPQQTLQRWHASERLKARGYTMVRGKEVPQFVLADVQRVKAEMADRPKRKTS